MKNLILKNMSVFTLAKLERRAASESKTVEQYVSSKLDDISFLPNKVEPNQH